MSAAQVTEAHRAITERVCELLDSEEMVGPSPAERAAQIIADSEAKACDQLRADVEQWELAFQEQFARAESAEREVERLRSETGRIGRNGAEEYIRAERVEAELAAERARLDWLMAGGVCMVQHSGGFYVSRLHAQVSRAAIDAAMKEETK